MILLPVIITLSCGSGYVVGTLLGPKWAAATSLISILAWLCLFSPISYVFSVVLIATGHLKRNFSGRVAVAITKVIVLLTIVSSTARLDVIATVSAITFTLECGAYTFLLYGVPGVNVRRMGLALLRALATGSLTVLCLYMLGLAWQDVSVVGLEALIEGALLGLLTATIYASAVMLLWLSIGRPEGPERTLYELGNRYYQVGLTRLSKQR